MTKFHVSGASDKGCVRTNNEDCYIVAGLVEQNAPINLELTSASSHFCRHGLLCAIADGLGGHAGGEFASQFVLERLAKTPIEVSSGTEAVKQALSDVVIETHKALLEQMEARRDLQGMGTTLSGILLAPDFNVIFHAGDSRVYRFRDGYLLQLTKDHVLEAATANSGEAQTAKNNMLTNSLGGGRGMSCFVDVESDVSFVENDMILLCTDGLYNCVVKEGIKSILASEEDSNKKTARLISQARHAGAPDNVSVILISLQSEAQAERDTERSVNTRMNVINDLQRGEIFLCQMIPSASMMRQNELGPWRPKGWETITPISPFNPH